MRLNAYASLPNYWRHMAPIWEALPTEARGKVYCPGRAGQAWGVPIDAAMAGGPVMVASYADAVVMDPRPLIFVEHGAGQTYGGDPYAAGHPSYPGGTGLERVVLFVCPGEAVAERWRARYDVPAVAVGCPALDRFHQQQFMNHESRIALAFHWDLSLCPETRSAWPHYDAALADLVDHARKVGWTLLGHGHPRLWGAIERRWRELGVARVPDVDDVFARADVLVVDNSSVLYEWASCDRPAVVLDAPWYRREVDHGLRFWEHADVGVRIGQPIELIAAIEQALADDDPHIRANRAAASRAVYSFTDGRAAERAVAAILSRLEDQLPTSPEVRTASERQSAAVALYGRLRALGATRADIAAFRQAWGAETNEMVHLHDDVLLTYLDAALGRDRPPAPAPIEESPEAIVMGRE